MTANNPSNMRPLLARDREEEHRTATQLELLFDLVFVVAIAAAAHGLRHEIAAGHVQSGIVKFLMAFFCVWWPWNLFTWFATSFDNDDAGTGTAALLWPPSRSRFRPRSTSSVFGWSATATFSAASTEGCCFSLRL